MTQPRQLLAPEALTPLDFMRIRKTLGVDPYEAFGKHSGLEKEQRMVLLVWAFNSRTDPAYTLEQAQSLNWTEIADTFLFEGEGEEEDQGEEDQGEDAAVPPSPPAAAPEPTANGTSPPKRAASPSSRRRANSGNERSAAPTSV